MANVRYWMQGGVPKAPVVEGLAALLDVTASWLAFGYDGPAPRTTRPRGGYSNWNLRAARTRGAGKRMRSPGGDAAER